MRWQGKDERFYRDIQLAAEGNLGASADALDVVDDLETLMAPLPENVEVWLGVRTSQVSFGVPSSQLDDLIGVPLQVPRFFATSLNRSVAESEFTAPGSDPVLYRIAAQAGSPAVWVPPLGAPNEAYQQELLFPRGVVVRIVAVDRMHQVPIVTAEVSDE
ncbi:ADP-ribosyltransferase [Mycolicibacterium frederiksbergense]